MRYASIIALLLTSTAYAVSPTPTLCDIAYGDALRQKLDFYQAKAETPTPLLFFIHGGGWMNGDKASFNNAAPYLAAGISVVSIEYRFVTQAAEAGIKLPVMLPLHDAARALQFVRSHAREWNLDTTRITASGSSAGACPALWLAFHDDLADPRSSDPIARQSTRLFCVAVVRAQTSLDPQQMREWIPNCNYGAHAFGFKGDADKGLSAFEEFLAAHEKILPWIDEVSPYALLTPDDPPVALYYDEPPAMGHDQASPAHSANFGLGLAAKLQQLGIDHELVYPGAPNVRHPLIHEYLIAKLRDEKPDLHPASLL
jgi:acetyl esterase/lipase